MLSPAPIGTDSPEKAGDQGESEGSEEQNSSSEPSSPVDGTVIPIEGEIDKFQVIFLRRSIEKARKAESETIIFSINTFGGRVDSALQMATLIGSLDDVHTVAYIPAEPESLGVSWSAGALISFSCNEIYMAPGTSIGAAAPVFRSSEGTKAAGEKTVSAVRTQLAALAEKNGYPKEVAIAMVDQDAELVEIRENGRVRFEISDSGESSSGESDDTAEAGGAAGAAGADGESLSNGDTGGARRRVVSPSGKLLTLTAGEMEEYGISSGTVSNMQALFDELEIEKTLEVAPTDADKIVGFLSSAAVTSMLLTIGLLALYLEISSPGFGLPGTLAVLAFAVLFFSGGLLGTLGSIELILFLLGVVLLVVEIFLIPGFGVAGISGLLLMSIGLILSRQGFVLPETDWQWDLFFQNLSVVFGTFALSFILMGVLMFFFPRIRLFRRLILSTTSGGGYASDGLEDTRTARKSEREGKKPTHEEAGEAEAAEKEGPEIGATGTVKTKLRPAGRVEIDGENYSVVTDGEWIEQGEEVKVIEVAGNRIVVERSE